MAAQTAETGIAPKVHYLNADYGIRSWLLTTDHKRIGILYLISITFFFAIGGLMAGPVPGGVGTPRGGPFPGGPPEPFVPPLRPTNGLLLPVSSHPSRHRALPCTH